MSHFQHSAFHAHLILNVNRWPVFPDLKADVSLSFQSEITVMVGRNGSGKTRFARLACGEESWAGASVARHSRIAYLPQKSILPRDMSIAEHLNVAEQLQALERLSNGLGREEDLDTIDDQWDLPEKIDKVLLLVGLDQMRLTRRTATLSGGEFTRLELARLQLSQADFLILDEPTNHLDQAAQSDVLRFIDAWKGGMLIISHHRKVLDKADRILELSSIGLKTYQGNYADFLDHKHLEKDAIAREFEQSKKRAKHIKQEAQSSHEKAEKRANKGENLRVGGRGKRTLADGSHGKSALDQKKNNAQNSAGKRLRKTEAVLADTQSDVKAIESRLEKFTKLKFELPAVNVKLGKILVRIEDLSFTYPGDSKELIQNLDLSIKAGDKIAILGPNGSGKSTLLRLINGQLPLPKNTTNGTISRGNIKVAYLDQKTELLGTKGTIFDAFKSLNPEANAGEVHAALARFLFRADEVFKEIEHLSGGERIRCSLAALLYSRHPPHLLLLDEPNNHLDLDSQLAVAKALSVFEGGLVLVSHDDAFLKDIGILKHESRVYLGHH
jgi:ATPase subunit of ABC transporter with duplicated ATPase domains